MSNKHIDKGNKRRFFKNVLRFIKHPIAYVYWKFYTRTVGKRVLHFALMFMLYREFNQYLSNSQGRRDYTSYLVTQGINPTGDGTQRTGMYDQNLDIPGMFLTNLFYSRVNPLNVKPSPAHTQAYRKHFDLRRYYGINK